MPPDASPSAEISSYLKDLTSQPTKPSVTSKSSTWPLANADKASRCRLLGRSSHTPSWDPSSTLPAMFEERYGCQGVGYGGKFMVISGCTAESYNPKTLKWVKEEDDELWSSGGSDPWSWSWSMIFNLPSPEGERLWHMNCNTGRERCIKEYNRSAKTWRVVAYLPDVDERLHLVPLAVVGGDGCSGVEVFVVAIDLLGKDRAWMMKDARMRREWKKIFIPFKLSYDCRTAALRI